MVAEVARDKPYLQEARRVFAVVVGLPASAQRRLKLLAKGQMLSKQLLGFNRGIEA